MNNILDQFDEVVALIRKKHQQHDQKTHTPKKYGGGTYGVFSSIVDSLPKRLDRSQFQSAMDAVSTSFIEVEARFTVEGKAAMSGRSTPKGRHEELFAMDTRLRSLNRSRRGAEAEIRKRTPKADRD